MSEITAEDYSSVSADAYVLHKRISNLMHHLAGPPDPAWHELYELMQLAGVIADAADRYRERSRLSREPAGFRPVFVPASRGRLEP